MPHAPFAPSSAKRWIACPGSFALGLAYPPGSDSEYAAEGTRLHDVAAKVLTAPRQPMSDSGYVKRHGALPPGTPTGEDARVLKPYLDYARLRIANASAYAVEETIHHSQMLWGTPDLLLMFQAEDLLEVVDLKTGQGIIVEPEENDQALCYAYMALRRITEDIGQWPKRVRLTIVQPPDEERPVKSWDTTAAHVFEWGARAEAAMALALRGGAPLQPGDHCRFCNAKPTCPALRGEALAAIESDGPAKLPVAMLPVWLDKAERLEGFIKQLREVAHEVASIGMANGNPQAVPGYVLKPKRATRSWADEEAVLAIARKRKIKIWQDKLMSPKMAEDTHPNLPEELTKLIVSVSSGTNLVRLKEGMAPPAIETLKPEANPMDKLMANFELLKYRR